MVNKKHGLVQTTSIWKEISFGLTIVQYNLLVGHKLSPIIVAMKTAHIYGEMQQEHGMTLPATQNNGSSVR
jgi:hypothetical protein